jgi:hypothetical protein
MRNRHADVNSLGGSRVCSAAEVAGGARVRSRFSSPAWVAGEARCGREGVLLRHAFWCGGDEAKVAASRRSNAPAHPRPPVAPLWRQRRARELLYRSLRPAVRHLGQVMFPLAPFLKDVVQVVGDVVVGRLDLA